MKRVVIIGPESTGKSTLGKRLSEVFDCGLVGEYARDYISDLDRSYTIEDLRVISKGQICLEQEIIEISDLRICDTDLLTIKVWSEYKYGKCDPWIIEQLMSNLPDLYLLCYPDIAWEFDSLRENPNDGLELFETYLSEIKELGVPFEIIKGQGQDRLTSAENSVAKIII